MNLIGENKTTTITWRLSILAVCVYVFLSLAGHSNENRNYTSGHSSISIVQDLSLSSAEILHSHVLQFRPDASHAVSKKYTGSDCALFLCNTETLLDIRKQVQDKIYLSIHSLLLFSPRHYMIPDCRNEFPDLV